MGETHCVSRTDIRLYGVARTKHQDLTVSTIEMPELPLINYNWLPTAASQFSIKIEVHL
jgi:hypothetical protein